MIRELALADVITLGNASCGMAAILQCLRFLADRSANPTNTPSLWAAFVLLPIAMACDVADGSVARWRRKWSAIGADLDSLADVVSFGVAPAVLGFTVGLRGTWDTIILVYFVACGIGRLARYNATADEMSDETGKVKHYEGTPIPTSLSIIALLAVAYAQGRIEERLYLGKLEIGPWDFHPLVLLYALSGSLMISTIKVPKL
ncbi:MAG: CDP-alcohol phosphatidyltransferase family protein [Polyangiales bacterium]